MGKPGAMQLMSENLSKATESIGLLMGSLLHTLDAHSGQVSDFTQLGF